MKSKSISKRAFIITVAILSCIVVAIGVLAIVLLAGKNTSKDYDMSGITFKDTTVGYDGKEHTLEVIGKLPEGVTVEYTPNKLTEMGSLEVTATFTGASDRNPIPSMTATLTIVKGTYDMSGVSFGSVTLPYDGLEHMLVLEGQLPEGVSVSYSPNKLTEIGFVEVTATFTYDSEHYNPISNKTATLTIVKGTHDMSGVTFEDKTVSYDGKEHALEISGNLPEGVAVSYTPNTLNEVGSITVTASFTCDKVHYNEIPDRTATLTVDGDGKYHRVTFIIDEDDVQSIMVEHGSSVKDAPEIPQKTGYNGEWDKPLTSITEDLTVHINYIPKQYTITYIPNGGYIKERTQTVTYGEPFVLHEATKVGHSPRYMADGEEIDSGIWKIAENTTVSLDWEADKYKMTYIFNGATVIEDYATYGTQYSIREYVLETCEAMSWTSGNNSYTPKSNVNVTFTADRTLIANIVHFANDYKVSIADGNATITKYTGSEIDVVIPDRVKVDGQNYDVTAIAPSAFYSTTTMQSLLIPSGITSIDDYAFSWCSNLETVYWDATACTVEFSIFSGCNKLTMVIFGDNITTIPEYAFLDCGALTSVTIPDSVTSIGNSAFNSCSGLMSITIPDSVTTIGNGAFSQCYGLTSITIPDSVTSIGNSAFNSCRSLTSVTIPSSVTTIGYYAFDGCSNLETVYWNATACGACPQSFPIFNLCDKFTTVIFGDNVTTIPEYAFKSCRGLTSVTIPDSITTIGSYAFETCNALTNIYYTGDIADWCKISGLSSLMSYGSSDKKLYIDGKETTGELIIPESVTSIGRYAFNGCGGLTSVTIRNGVTTIDEYAFQNCSELTSVTIGNSVTSIGWGAFQNCSGLTSVTIGNSVTTIKPFAFKGCSGLTSVTIPDSVTIIDSHVFQNCSGLTSITIPNSVTTIGYYAFDGCSNLTSVIFENTVGWRYSNSESAISSTSIPSSDLEDASTAVTCLTSTYCKYYWKRR